MTDHSSHIHTFSGRLVDPLNLKPEDVCIEDIAHHLSNQCRFSGAPRSFYSVGQHSVLVSRVVGDALGLDGLIHDGSEAYFQDMARPLKHHPDFGRAYRRAEDRAQEVIRGVFGLGPEPPEVHAADETLIVTEARDLMHGVEKWLPHYADIEPLAHPIIAWSPKRTEREFLRRFHALTERRTK